MAPQPTLYFADGRTFGGVDLIGDIGTTGRFTDEQHVMTLAITDITPQFLPERWKKYRGSKQLPRSMGHYQLSILVPEPSTFVPVGTGIVGLVGLAKRKFAIS